MEGRPWEVLYQSPACVLTGFKCVTYCLCAYQLCFIFSSSRVLLT